MKNVGSDYAESFSVLLSAPRTKTNGLDLKVSKPDKIRHQTRLLPNDFVGRISYNFKMGPRARFFRNNDLHADTEESVADSIP